MATPASEKTQSEVTRLALPKDGQVLITSEDTVRQRDIAASRNEITARLHACYLNVVEEMSEFQAQYNDNRVAAMYNSTLEGLNAGGADWLADQKEMLTLKYWDEVGENAEKFVMGMSDRAYIYVRGRFNEVYKDFDEKVFNSAWWSKRGVKDLEAFRDEQIKKMEATLQSVTQVTNDILETKDKAIKIYQHREAILALPAMIAQADTYGIANFVNTALMDIDPELAKEIGTHPRFKLVLALIRDDDSVITYLSYLGLIISAIPPNFYAYVAGKGSAYLMIEVVLLAVTAILSAGAAAAARITLLIGRLAATGVRAISANSKIKRAQRAIDSVERVLEDVQRAADEFQNLGYKLIPAQNKSYMQRSGTRSTVHAKQEMIQRDAKCRVCQSNKHTTPTRQRGQVEYE